MKIRQTGLLFLFLVIWTVSTHHLSAVDWGVKSSPAVVNPAVKSEYQEILTLAGEWDFKTGSVVNRIRVGDGIWGNPGWDMSGARKIQVPGLWEPQGVGEQGAGKTWDCIWDCGQWVLRHQYLGNACYQREIEIPATWEKKRVFLKVGGLRTEAFFWINGQRAAYVNNYCATEKFEITPFLKVGEKNMFSIFMRNDTPSRKGLLSVNHSFGGFYRDLELEAVPETFIDDVWVASDFQNLSAVVNIQLAGAVENAEVAKNAKKTVKIEIQTRDGKTVAQRLLEKEVSGVTAFKTVIPIPNCQVWSPENPFLYHAVVTLLDENGTPTHGWCERFGIRELKVVGKQFYLNGKPYFLRGAGDHNYDSISIMEPACRERFLEHMKTYKAAGFNATRHHTHCPLPEYFEAADEMGLLLQPELPYYHDVPTEGFLFDPMRDLQELYQHYRRYVSFTIYSCGNEGHLGSPLAEEIYQWVKKNDPARIIQHQDGGLCTSENSDFTTGGILTIKPWASGTLEQFNMPVVAHEFLNLAIKMDPALEPRFNGVRIMPPMLENQAKLLEKCKLDAKWGQLCVAASERLQAIYQKQGVEAARLDPECDGYFFWSLVDVGAMNGDIPASQGYLNVFWEPRPNGWKPEEFLWFNGPTVLLVKPDRDTPITVTGEKIVCDVHLSHFGAETLPAGPLTWRFGDASGTVNVGEISPGFVGSIAKIEISIPSVKKPEITEMRVTFGKVQNAWKWRIFPEEKKPSLAGCVISPELWDFFTENYADVRPYQIGKVTAEDTLIISLAEEDVLQDAIQSGARILAVSPVSESPNVSLGWWGLGTQTGMAIDAEHPFLGDFPTETWMDELWFRMIRQGAHDLRSVSPLGRLTPVVVGEGRDAYYLYVGEGKIGNAHVLATFAVALIQETPEAKYLLRKAVKYLQKEDFTPCAEVSAKMFQTTLPPGTQLGFRKTLSAQEEGFWSTWYTEMGKQWICRQTQLGNDLRWETDVWTMNRDEKVPTPGKNAENAVTFVFGGGLGYFCEPKTEGFEFLLNGKPLLMFDLPEKEGETDVFWKSPDGKSVLRFEIVKTVYPGPDFFGRFYLTVPAEMLKQGEKQEFTVRSFGKNSRRWFGLYSTKNLMP